LREFKVTAAQDGKHVVKASSEAFPGLSQSDLFRALKHKDIKIDGKRTSQDVAVREGQTVEVWLPDELFGGSKKTAPAEDAKPEK
jgi:23S rRNA pseudouridine955/2504/2580 synthase